MTNLPEGLRAEAENEADLFVDRVRTTQRVAFLRGCTWLLQHLANSAPEFDEKATSLSAGKNCTGTQGAHDRDCNKCNGYLKGARWQHEQDKARIAFWRERDLSRDGLAQDRAVHSAKVQELEAKVKGLVEAVRMWEAAKYDGIDLAEKALLEALEKFNSLE